MQREPADGCDAGNSPRRTLGDGAESTPRFADGTGPGDFSSNEDLSSLRCSSLQIEEVQIRRNRNRQPSAGYPGLAFGSPMYSNTLFKFSLIANEIKDLKQNQLKKVCANWRSSSVGVDLQGAIARVSTSKRSLCPNQ